MADESALGDHKLKVAGIGLFACVIVATIGAIGWYYQDFLKDQYHWHLVMRPSVLTAEQEKEKAAKPGSDFKECAKGCPTMIVVPAGTFLMGSPEGKDNGDDQERPRHEVTIAKPFAVGRTDVTFAEWDICVAAGACPKVPDVDAGWGRGERPVVLVNWEEAKSYAAWLKRMTGKDYRLLSETEWEYAARAGNQGRWSFGDDEHQVHDYAWFRGNSSDQIHPVAKKKPSAFGLYDMHGNVWQWVEDCYHNSYQGAPSNGSQWVEGCSEDKRVVRGGSWFSTGDRVRSALRYRHRSYSHVDNVGFRVGRTLTP